MESNFRANVRIKDLVGRGLINNNIIAVIELIKNAKDAMSDQVNIMFIKSNEASPDSKLIIQDFGTGMSLADLKDKWLNIAYSEKANSVKEDDTPYAGNKGVGRFSCDNIGSFLELYTKTKKDKLLKLTVNWEDFEVDNRDMVVSDIPVQIEHITMDYFCQITGLSSFTQGTCLVISKLRSIWDRKELDSLRKNLEKFVADPKSTFDIFLSADSVFEKRTGEIIYKNWKVENKIFQTLSGRTTNIHLTIDDQNNINTQLNHNGNWLFKIREVSPYKYLKNIEATIYFLNMGSKRKFYEETGYRNIDYGSILLYLNSFRVMPYGDAGDDWLHLDQRKSQGHSRYLGSRDVVGIVSISDTDKVFNPVTSREGLVQNAAFLELTSYRDRDKVTGTDGKEHFGLITRMIRTLERFVVEGMDWDRIIKPPKGEKIIFDNLEYINRSKEIIDSLYSVIHSYIADIEKIEVNEDYLQILAEEQKNAYIGLLNRLQEKYEYLKFDNLSQSEMISVGKLLEQQDKLVKVKEETVKRVYEQNFSLESLAKNQENIIHQNKSLIGDLKAENLFLQSDMNKDVDDIVNLHHQVILYISTIELDLENFLYDLKDISSIKTQKVIDFIYSIYENTKKISKISQYATNKNYKIAATSVTGNILKFISDYVKDLIQNNFLFKRISLINSIKDSKIFIAKFSPLDVMVLIDNLIDNAKKAKASEITFLTSEQENDVVLVIYDNGKGLDPSIKDKQLIFQKGFTTTDGSGRGLHHVLQTLNDIGLALNVSESKYSTGLTLEVSKNAN